MKLDELERSLVDSIGHIEDGFGFKKAQRDYVHKLSEVVHIFRLKIIKWGDSAFAVIPEVFVGCPQFNKEFKRITGRNVEVNGLTFGFGVQNQHPGRGYYRVESAEDIGAAAASVRADFFEIAVPFFNEFTTLKSAESYLNKRDENGAVRPLSVSMACFGLVAAKLVGNPHFDQIFSDYLGFFRQPRPELAKPIEDVYKALTTNI